jgi:uncharacterized damage-inducible protein DinB
MYNTEELEKQDLFQIKKLEGFDTQFGHLISMMNYARITTLDIVEGLTISDLDFLLDEKANSIGMLLFHIASVDFIYRTTSVYKREPTAEEMEYWSPALKLGKEGRENIKGHNLNYYLETLANERKKTLVALQAKKDAWLFEESEFWDNKKANNYFKWFHVLEDEINHRGQIRMIKKRIF